MKTPEYREGPEALERFESLAQAILQAPEPKIKPDRSSPTRTRRDLRLPRPCRFVSRRLIREEISKLNQVLRLLGGGKTKAKGRRKMSAAARRKISAAQKARWKKIRAARK
jgi:hypothetical protein